MLAAFRSSRWFWIGAICLVLIPAIALAAQTLSPPVIIKSALSSPALRVENTSTGPAIQVRAKYKGLTASSTQGDGIIGSTSSLSTTSNGAKAGVEGQDVSGNQNVANSGVRGTSFSGYGVSALGRVGIFGEGDVAVNGTTEGIGALGDMASQVAVDANNPNESIDGLSWAVTATSGHGAAIYGETDQTPAANFTPQPTLQLVTHGGPPILVSSTSGRIMSLDTLGNMVIAGSLTQHGTPLTAHHLPAGPQVDTYSAQQTIATIEDFGTARLVAGHSYVMLENRYRSAIDPRAGYFVFLTPESDSNGLFVAQMNSAGFEVQENRGGRSTLTFQYRIVAKPLDSAATRLPVDRGMPQYRAPRPPRSLASRT